MVPKGREEAGELSQASLGSSMKTELGLEDPGVPSSLPSDCTAVLKRYPSGFPEHLPSMCTALEMELHLCRPSSHSSLNSLAADLGGRG